MHSIVRVRALLVGVLFGIAVIFPALSDPEALNRLFPGALIGDLNGDGVADAVVQPRTSGQPVKVLLGNTNSGRETLIQALPSDALGLNWVLGDSQAHLADFNGDGRADVFLQGRARATASAIVLADVTGELTSIAQTFDSRFLGLTWNADESNAVVGDFDGDHRADILLQPAGFGGTATVVIGDGDGNGTVGLGAQTWSDGFLARTWNGASVDLHPGDFDGDGRTDLLLAVTEDSLLAGRNAQSAFALTLANRNGQFDAIAQTWDRNAFGAKWDPKTHELVIGDFNKDGKADIWVRTRSLGGENFVLLSKGAAGFSGVAARWKGPASPAQVLAGKAAAPKAPMAPVTAAVDKPVPGDVQMLRTYPLIGTTTSGTRNALTSYTPGVTPSSFDVDATGAARYAIPLTTPPGIAGIQPSLAIIYSSNAGNGLAGMGFGVSGFSAIRRCTKNFAQDGVSAPIFNTSTDKYCLDGQRLRWEGGPAYGGQGTTYRTEIESFKRITSYTSGGQGAAVVGGPQYFTVETPDGLVYEYGSRDDSRLETTPTYQNVVRVWALSRVRDRFGNYMDYDYAEDRPNGDYRPTAIRWTGNGAQAPVYRADFVYEPRPALDVVSSFESGSLEKSLNRLIRIDVKYNGATIRDYRLTYDASSTSATQRSRVMSVQECAGGSCLPPHTMTWQNGEKGWTNDMTTSASGLFTSTERANAIPMDVNGDGREDLVFPRGGTWWVALVNTGGYAYSAPVNTARPFVSTYYQYALSTDLNGDGRKDLLVPGTTTWTAYFADGSANFFSVANGTNIPSDSTTRGKATMVDYDGDGLDDFVYATGSTVYQRRRNTSAPQLFDATSIPIYSSSSTFASAPFGTIATRYRSTLRTVNLDGDMRADLLVKSSYSECEQGQGCVTHVEWDAFSPSTGASYMSIVDPIGAPFPIDLNGDGRTDFAYVDASGYWQVAVNGTDTFTGIAASGNNANPVMALDYDSDGFIDLLTAPAGSGTWWVMRSTGASLTPAVDTGVQVHNDVYRVTDLNADGQDDFVQYLPGSSQEGWWYVFHKGTKPDLAVGFKDSLENDWLPTYLPITNGAVYSDSTLIDFFPVRRWHEPFYVVGSYDAPNGVGGSYAIDIKYKDARTNQQGRGFLGFGSRSVTDTRNGLYTEYVYGITFPFTTTLAQKITKQSATGAVIESTDFGQNNTVLGSGNDTRHLVFLPWSLSHRYEVGGTLNGTVISSMRRDYTYDAYGNVDLIVEGIGAGMATNAFTNTLNPLNQNLVGTTWCLGLVTSSSVSKQIGGGAAAVRTSSGTYDSVTCRPLTQSLPGDVNYPSPNLALTTAFGYDGYGNVSSVTTSGPGVATRVATSSYAATSGYHLSSATNALNQTITTTWNLSFGEPSQRTDANSLNSAFTYDAFGRPFTVTHPDRVMTRSTYGWWTSNCQAALRCLTNTIEVLNADTGAPGGQEIRMFDSMGRLKRTDKLLLGGQWSIQERVFDSFGRVVAEQLPKYANDPGFEVTRAYDLLGRVISETRPASEALPMGAVTTFAYEGSLTRETDANGKVTKRTVNARGDVTTMEDAANGITAYTYDPFGNLTRTTDALGHQINQYFDLRGNKRRMIDPDMGDWTYGYNAYGELISQTDAKAQVTSFTYDALGRLSTRVQPEGTHSWFYDTATGKGVGKLHRVFSSMDGYEDVYSYDAYGRLSQMRGAVEAGYQYLDYAYDVLSRVATMTYPASTGAARFGVAYEYDASGVLSKVKDANAPTTVFWTNNVMNALGEVTQETAGNGVVSNFGFDRASGRVGSIQSGVGGGSTVQNLIYAWDSIGNLTQRKEVNWNLTETFSYDNLYRLTSASMQRTDGTFGTHSATYNAIGNLTYLNGNTYAYGSPKPHAVTSTTGGWYAGSYQYDANGNMTQKTVEAAETLTWTSYNYLASVTRNGESSAFNYAPDRKRFRQISTYSGSTETTWYLVGGLVEKVIKPGTTEWRHQIRAGDRVVAQHTRKSTGGNETRYFHRDHLGSVESITNEAGVRVAQLAFDPMGRRRVASDWSVYSVNQSSIAPLRADTAHGYTGHEMLDSVGLVHMNGRVYDPFLGRMISADPTVPSASNGQAFNRYSYVLNNPLRFTDPSGFNPYSVYSMFGGLIEGAGAVNAWVTNTLHQINYYSLPVRAVGNLGVGTASIVGGFEVQLSGLEVGISGNVAGGNALMAVGTVLEVSGVLQIQTGMNQVEAFINGTTCYQDMTDVPVLGPIMSAVDVASVSGSADVVAMGLDIATGAVVNLDQASICVDQSTSSEPPPPEESAYVPIVEHYVPPPFSSIAGLHGDLNWIGTGDLADHANATYNSRHGSVEIGEITNPPE